MNVRKELERLFTFAAKSTAAYVAAQILTGIEAAIVIVIMHLVCGYTIEAALAVAIPASFPFMFLQLIAIYKIIGLLFLDSNQEIEKQTS